MDNECMFYFIEVNVKTVKYTSQPEPQLICITLDVQPETIMIRLCSYGLSILPYTTIHFLLKVANISYCAAAKSQEACPHTGNKFILEDQSSLLITGFNLSCQSTSGGRLEYLPPVPMHTNTLWTWCKPAHKVSIRPCLN